MAAVTETMIQELRDLGIDEFLYPEIWSTEHQQYLNSSIRNS